MWKPLIILALCATSFGQLTTMDQIPTPRQSNQATGDTVGFSAGVVSGNFLVAHYSGGGTFTPAIGDTCLSSWTLRVNNLSNGSAHGYVWTAPAGCTGANTVTITESGSTVPVLGVYEFANVAGFDAVGTGGAPASGNVITLPSVTTTKYRDLILDIVIQGPTITTTGPHDTAYVPDFLAEDTSTTNESAYAQTRLTGNPGVIAGVNVATSSASGGSLQVSLAMTSTAALTVSTPAIPDAVVSQSYSFQLQATGGAGTNVWSINSGTLPCGLSLSLGGVISGTPTCSNANTIQFSVTDVAAANATKNLTLHVGTSASTITRVQGSSGASLTGVTLGNTIIFGIMNTSAFGAIYAQNARITDGLGSTYTPIPCATSDLVQLYWGVIGSNGNISMTVTPSFTSGFTWISEWTNIRMIFDTGVCSKYISTTGTSPISSAAITSPVAEMLYAFASPGTAAATVTVSAPFSRDINTSGGTSARQSESDYEIAASAGSNTATWTTSGNTASTFNMTLLGFRPTVSGTAPVKKSHPRSQIY